MSKDAFYFSHDSNAKDDPKCVLLIEQLGMEGYGIYWMLIEILRDQPDYTYPINLLPALARRYNATPEKVETVVFNYGLFEVENDIIFFSQSLINRMIPLQQKREQARLAGLESARKKALKSADYNECSTSVQRPFNECSTSKVKESKVKKNINRATFVAPSVSDVENYFTSEKQISESEAKTRALQFLCFYESKSWMVGKTKMSNWKSAATNALAWELPKQSNQTQTPNEPYTIYR